MNKRFRVSGLFNLEIEAKDSREATTKARKILRDSGIDGYVIDAEKRTSNADNRGDTL